MSSLINDMRAAARVLEDYEGGPDDIRAACLRICVRLREEADGREAFQKACRKTGVTAFLREVLSFPDLSASSGLGEISRGVGD
jgi:hypothetical protein